MEADLRDLKALEHTLESAHRRIWGAGLQLRVIPVDGLFGRLSRAARDLAQKLGKDLDVVIEGREVRIDKSMVDVLIDPLMHMVRNAIDHGVEPAAQRRAAGKPMRATLSISASERGNSVDIIIADDGRGLDRSKILAKALSLGMVAPHQAEQMAEADINALIFRPGFSTADSVTEISGRGVGLDVGRGGVAAARRHCRYADGTGGRDQVHLEAAGVGGASAQLAGRSRPADLCLARTASDERA